MSSTNGTSGSSHTRSLPTIISSRSVFGITPGTSRRNIAWSSDGQCLLVTKQGVTVATPYLATTLPKPELVLDASMQGGPTKVDEDDDDEEMDLDAESSAAGRRLERPRKGEIDWWMTAVGFDKGKAREESYGWADVGDEFTGVVTDRDKERAVGSVTWSPSGLSDLGTPLLAILTSTSQVSVFAPGDDLYTKEFVEVADLTRAAIDILPREDYDNGTLSIRGMLRVRTTAMEWSRAVSDQSLVGINGSLLALANRAGGIDFWSYDSGNSFNHVGSVNLPKPWASDVTWSNWKDMGASFFVSKLAIATSDGAVYTVQVTRTAYDNEGTWSLELREPDVLSEADGRSITVLQWMTDNLLVWAKSGSVHLHTPSWTSPQMVRLERVGNWAGCNALSACVGLHLANDTLTVVLSSLTYHLIDNTSTKPKLAPMVDSLRLTLASRDAFLDCTRRRRRGFRTSKDEEYTAHTAAWAAMEASGEIVSWIAEPITFHDLDSATEVNRISDFVIADLKVNPHDVRQVVAGLASVLDHPPNLLQHSPLGVLLPHLLRLIVCEGDAGQELCTLVSAETPAADGTVLPTFVDPWRTLMTAMWDAPSLNRLRIRLVLAHWGKRAFPNLAIEFSSAVATISAALQHTLATTELAWVTRVAGDTVGTLDAQYIGHLLEICERTEAPLATSSAAISRLRGLASNSGGGACPACSSAITLGTSSSALCENGHEWERCSVSHLLITTPDYRLCTVCPAVSLLPDGLTARGSDGDDTLIETALKVAVDCLNCGGRWARAI